METSKWFANCFWFSFWFTEPHGVLASSAMACSLILLGVLLAAIAPKWRLSDNLVDDRKVCWMCWNQLTRPSPNLPEISQWRFVDWVSTVGDMMSYYVPIIFQWTDEYLMNISWNPCFIGLNHPFSLWHTVAQTCVGTRTAGQWTPWLPWCVERCENGWKWSKRGEHWLLFWNGVASPTKDHKNHVVGGAHRSSDSRGLRWSSPRRASTSCFGIFEYRFVFCGCLLSIT